MSGTQPLDGPNASDTYAPQHAKTTVGRILVATDFSASAGHALDYAETLAGPLGAEVVLLHVGGGPGTLPVEDFGASARHPSEECLDAAVQALRARAVRARGVVRGGFPVDEIVRAAAAERADLIVLGTRGRSGAQHLLMGSVAEQVVRRAACPVLTVPRQPEAE